jgi:hypothetical protein
LFVTGKVGYAVDGTIVSVRRGAVIIESIDGFDGMVDDDKIFLFHYLSLLWNHRDVGSRACK